MRQTPEPLRPARMIKPAGRIEALLRDEARFLKTWLDNPKSLGAVSPSGRFLARMMARYVDVSVPGPIIELGPGTGPVTEALLKRGVAQERLILVEYDRDFCRLLRKRFPRARVIQGDAYALGETLRGHLDTAPGCVVSSLPLLTRPERDRLALLFDAFRLMHPRGVFVQFTYGVLSPIPRDAGGFGSEVSPPVWLNLPPARVWIYRPNGGVIEPSRPHGIRNLVGRLKYRGREVGDGLKSRTAEVGARLRSGASAIGGAPLRPALALLRRVQKRRRR